MKMERGMIMEAGRRMTYASGATARLTETALHVFGVFENSDCATQLKPHYMSLVLLSLRVLGCHLPNGLQHQEVS